ncbi:MAG TPA: hypothetical protein VKC54_04135 [Patescibacteria group bacterium]|nr:hypothetical protein [Patescibacteria group bacterium]
MLKEKPSQEERLDKRRVHYAALMLDPQTLVGYVMFDTQFHDKQLPDFIEWNKDTDLGEGNVHINGMFLGRYFKSQEEFLESCMYPKNNEGDEILDENQKPIRIVRDFNNNIDTNQFPIDSKKYSVIKVFVDDSIALACKTGIDGNFSIDVYPSKELKRDILMSLMKVAQNNMNADMVKIKESRSKIENYLEQLKSFN